MPARCKHGPTLLRCAHANRGTVLIVTLLVLALLALGVGSYLSLNLHTSRLARSSYQQNAAFHLAEAGAEEGLWSFNQAHAGNPAAWAGWTTQGAAAWRTFDGFDFGGHTTGSVKVYTDNAHPAGTARPHVVALSQITTPGLPANSRMIEVTLGRRSFFSTGIVARDKVKFSGTNTTVDSWNSDPDQDPGTAAIPYSEAVRQDRGSIGTLAVENSAVLINHATIWGRVATAGGAPEVGTHGSIRGADTPVGVRIDPARVTTDFTADLPLLSAPLDGTPLAAVGDTLGTAGEATRWRVPSVSLNGSKSLTILGDVTLILTATTGSALDVTGNASIIIPAGSSLVIYVEADLKVAGKGIANGNHHPGALRIFGSRSTNQSIHIAGNGALKAAVYAPNAEIRVNGNGDVMGALVGATVTFTGNAAFHYDESLATGGDDAPFGVVRWRELNTGESRAPWATVFADQ